jgi:mRNA interferase RelE/StbE
MTAFLPQLPPELAEIIRHLPPEIKREIKQALRVLSTDPEAGEPLRRELDGLWKYRVRRYRIVYGIDRQRRRLLLVAVGPRNSIYEDVTARTRRQ